MKGQSGYQNTAAYQKIASNKLFPTQTDDDVKSIALRYLIHYVGDLHQPLHAVTLYSPQFVSGDRGGNSFSVTGSQGVNNLHALWDSALYELGGSPKMPLSPADWTKLGQTTSGLVNKHAEVKPVSSDVNPHDWALESLKVAQNFVYKGIDANGQVPQSYIQQSQSAAEAQIVKAGTRLSNILKDIYRL